MHKDVSEYAGAWLTNFKAKNPPRMKRFPNALEEDENYLPVAMECCADSHCADSPEFEFEDV